ncbi:MAG: type II toxin-antitoxin system VapC family toxin [Sphingomonadales bacterium]
MESAVIDSSVAIKWTIEEESSSEALALASRSSLMAPCLLLTECANILWRKVRYGQVSAQHAIEWHGDLSHAPIEYLDDHALLPRALALAVELDHPVYDCLYLAASEASGAPLVTADAKLYRKLAANSGVTIPPILLRDLGF